MGCCGRHGIPSRVPSESMSTARVGAPTTQYSSRPLRTNNPAALITRMRYANEMRWILYLMVSWAFACSGQVNTNQSTTGTGGVPAQTGGAGGSASPAGGQYNGSGGTTTGYLNPVGGATSGTGGSNPISVPCTADASATGYQSPASGTFKGADLDGFICTGGVVAYMERTQASSYVGSQLLVMITSALTGNSATDLQFANPSDATGGMFTIMAGVGSATPGTYSSSNGTSCGSLAFCIYLPLPPGVQCPDDAGACDSKYCAMQGPVSGPTCQPVTPEVCYETRAANSCLPDTQTVLGSWTMNLTSVTPYVSDAGSGGMSYYVVHGSFVATMVGDLSAADAGVVTANLTMSF